MTFRRRTFPEVLDALLVAVTGGVAAEPYPFPPTTNGSTGPQRHALQRQAAALVSVYGSRGGEPHNERLVGTVGGERIGFGDMRFRVGEIVASKSGRITYGSASARRDRLNAQLIRCGQPPLPPLARWSP